MKNTEYGFGRLTDHIGARPVLVAEHGRPAIVALSAEEYKRLKVVEAGAAPRFLFET